MYRGGGGMPPATIAASVVDACFYRDPMRVKTDASNVLKVFTGLTPAREDLVSNTGAVSPLLNLTGTVPINYRGATYNIPVKIWVQEGHPHMQPMCYVEPTHDMEVKRDHPCVARDGRVDLGPMPYSPAAPLIEVLRYLQRRFAENPPVYAKAKTASSLSKDELLPLVTKQASAEVHKEFRKTADGLEAEFGLQSQLSDSARTIEDGLKSMRDTIRALQSHRDAVAEKTVLIQSWVESRESDSKHETDIDELVQAPDALSAQLMRVVAESAACEDALFVLDRAVANDAVTPDVFVKECRKVARKQFMAKALALKICAAQRDAGYGLAGAGPR